MEVVKILSIMLMVAESSFGLTKVFQLEQSLASLQESAYKVYKDDASNDYTIKMDGQGDVPTISISMNIEPVSGVKFVTLEIKDIFYINDAALEDVEVEVDGIVVGTFETVAGTGVTLRQSGRIGDTTLEQGTHTMKIRGEKTGVVYLDKVVLELTDQDSSQTPFFDSSSFALV